nr:hypothetical protein [Tanacetum cinerariifolium]
MKDLIEVSDAKITIRSSLGFLRDVKKKLKEPGNEKCNTLFQATIFGKWLGILAFADDNLLLNYIFHHQVSAEPSVDCPPITYSICGNSFEFGRKEFFLITGFLFGKLPKKKLTKGMFVASSHYCFYGSRDKTLNVVPRKNERDSKKDTEKVVEPTKKKKKPAKSSKKKNKADEQSPKKMTTYNLYGFVWSLKIYILEIFPNSKYWWKKDPNVIPRGISWSIIEKFHKKYCSHLFAQCDTTDETSQLDLNIHYDDHVQDLNSAYQDMDKDSNIHCEDHVEEQNSPFQDMDKESNIHSHGTVEQQNSPNMCKEHVLAEFDAIKATVDIIDKRKGERSVGFNDMLDLECKDHQLNDNIPITLVKPIDMMCGEVNKSGDKLDETLDVGVIVDCATLQSSPPPNAMDHQDPQPTDKDFQGSFGFDDMLDLGSKDHLLNDTVPKGLVKRVDMMCGEDNISND